MRKQGGLARPRTLRFPTSVRNKKLVWHCYPIIKTPVDQLFNWINFHVKSAADAMRGHITKYWPNNIIQIQNFPLFIGSRCKISPISLGQDIKFPPFCWVKIQNFPLFVGTKFKIQNSKFPLFVVTLFKIHPFLMGQNSKFTPFYWVKIQNSPLIIVSIVFCKSSSLRS